MVSCKNIEAYGDQAIRTTRCDTNCIESEPVLVSLLSERSRAMAPILVMGLGNVLLQDEGLGVRALRRLTERYILPNVCTN